MNRKEVGALGEKLAAASLKKKGYRIIETNYRCRFGEIDIVARKKDTLIFVEVRTKSSDAFGAPEESVTHLKQNHLIATAEHYISTHRELPESRRFDFVAVELEPGGKLKRLELIENAIE
jgi:putative endonuclease